MRYGPKSVSLFPHNYSAEFKLADLSGKFCTQFNAFRDDPAGRTALTHWAASCFKYDKSAPFAYPGQTELDDWPERFEEWPSSGIRAPALLHGTFADTGWTCGCNSDREWRAGRFLSLSPIWQIQEWRA